jgi:hypothetical protein
VLFAEAASALPRPEEWTLGHGPAELVGKRVRVARACRSVSSYDQFGNHLAKAGRNVAARLVRRTNRAELEARVGGEKFLLA